ncbi:MAG: restriction endonuclease subunit S [Spirochaetales bacterium]|jgi:type I restriction enzyme S subunit|nr:restriction endonuclease subunit S [Spirochaetales bacterium]
MKSVTLETVAEIFNGKTPSKAQQRESGHPVLKIRDISADGNSVGPFGSFVEEGLAAKYPAKIVRSGDTLILNAAHNSKYVGSKSHFASKSTIGLLATGEWLIVRPDRTKANPNYINHFLTSAQMRSAIQEIVNGIHLYPKDVAKLQISLPSLDEQRRIAAVLDKADALRRLRQQSLDLTEKLIQSVFLDMFGDPAQNPKKWKTCKVGKMAKQMSDGPFGSNLKTAHYTEEGIRVLRLQDIGIGFLKSPKPVYISEEHYNTLPRNHCQPNDVIVGTMGEPNLRAAIIPPNLKESLNKADCVLIRSNNEIAIPEYICWLLNMPGTLALANKLILGETRARISMGRLRSLDVPLPPLELQKKFRTALMGILKTLNDVSNSAPLIEDLFNSLQQRAFSGDLDLSNLILDEEAEEIIQAAYKLDKLGNETLPRTLGSGITLKVLKPSVAVEKKLKSQDKIIEEDDQIPWSPDYFKYRLLAKQTAEIVITDLMSEADSIFTEPNYDAIRDILFDYLDPAHDNPVLAQTFDQKRKEIILQPA